MTLEGTTLPQLPDGWLWTKLSELTDVIRGASPRPKGDPRFFGGSIPWIMISDVTKARGKFISRTKDTVTQAGADKSRLLSRGTLILSNSGTVCVPKILAVDGCIHDGFVAFPELSKEIEMLYLFYYFEHIRSRMIQENRQGVTQVNLNTEIVKNIKVPFPPIEEQRRIVTKIEELLTQLDTGLEELRKAHVQLKRYRQTVLKAGMIGELTRQWREGHKDELEPASELLARVLKARRLSWETDQLAKRSARKTPKTDEWQKNYRLPDYSDVSRMPALPNEWEWGRLDALATIKGGITKDGKRKIDGRLVPYLRVANVQRGYLDLTVVKEINATEEEIAELKLKPGDILFNEGGDRDKLGRGWIWSNELPECIHQNHVFRARLYLNDISAKFVSLFSNTFGLDYFVREGKQTTNLASINLTKLSALPVPIPPAQEQKVIVEEIERTTSIVDALHQGVETALQQAQRMRQSILKHAFDGKLVEQDPNDERAELVLERIKIERAKREAQKQTTAKSNRKRFTKNRTKRTERPAA